MAVPTITFAETLKNTNIMLAMSGIPPCEEHYPDGVWQVLRRNVRFIAFTFMLGYTTFGELVYLWQMLEGDVNFLEVTFQAPCIGYCIIGVLKLITVAVRRNTIADLVGLFQEKWNQAIVTEEHRTVCMAVMRPAITVTSVTALVNIVMGIAFTMLPIAEMVYQNYFTGTWTRQLSFNIWWPFDERGGIKYFVIVYPLYVFIGFGGIVIHMSFDCLFCILAAHICMHFRILKLNLSQVVRSRGSEESDDNMDNLKDVISNHQDLIGCRDFMQNVFGNVLFINFFGSSIIICIQAFMITTVTGYTLVKFVLFMLCFLIELLMLCAYGEDILGASEEVAEAAYDCRWYDESKSFNKSILQIIQRSQTPVILKAWKFWPIEMSSLKGILQASWSYFTLLKTVYAER